MGANGQRRHAAPHGKGLTGTFYSLPRPSYITPIAYP